MSRSDKFSVSFSLLCCGKTLVNTPPPEVIEGSIAALKKSTGGYFFSKPQTELSLIKLAVCI
jgi:hypothetical protein